MQYAIFAGLLLAATSASAGSVVVEMPNIQLLGGQILIGLYNDPKAFPRDRSAILQAKRIEVKSETNAIVVFKDVKPGRYAISLFHDVNMNGVLDLGALNIPVEAWGASNNAPGNFGPPKFKAAAFDVSGEVVKQTIEINY